MPPVPPLWIRHWVVGIPDAITYANFGNVWLSWQPLRPWQSEMSYLHWLTPKTIPRTKNFVNSCYTTEVMSIRRFATSLALRE